MAMLCLTETVHKIHNLHKHNKQLHSGTGNKYQCEPIIIGDRRIKDIVNMQIEPGFIPTHIR